MFPEGHPYRTTIGSMATSTRELDDTRAWFRENYGPNNAVLVLAGDIDARTARPLVERYFGHIRRGPQNVPAAADVPTLKAPVAAVMRDRVANTRLYRVWAVPGRTDASAVPLEMAAAVLGGRPARGSTNEWCAGIRPRWPSPPSCVSTTRRHVPGPRDVKRAANLDAVARRLDAIIADLVRDGPTADEVQPLDARGAQRGAQVSRPAASAARP